MVTQDTEAIGFHFSVVLLQYISNAKQALSLTSRYAVTQVLILFLQGHSTKLTCLILYSQCVLTWKCHFSGSENDFAEVKLKKPSVSYFPSLPGTAEET